MDVQFIGDIDDLILPCRDIGAARDFYRDVMGFRLIDDRPDWIRFEVGSRRLILRPRGQWLMWDDGPMPTGSAAVQLAFCVIPADVDRAHEALVARGAEIVDPPRNQDFGHRTCFIRDPEGNILEIYAQI